jgi:hypothetical protein
MRRTSPVILVALLVPMMAVAQGTSPWTVVRFPTDAPFTLKFVSTRPDGCGNCDAPTAHPVGPTGEAKIKRDDQHTTLDLDISGLPPGPSRFYVYAIDENNRATKLATFRTTYKETLELPPDKYQAFMLIVSAQDNLKGLPPRNRIVLYSAVPSGLKAVAKPSQPQ